MALHPQRPLGVVDAHSVPDRDLVGAALIYPDRAGQEVDRECKPEPRVVPQVRTAAEKGDTNKVLQYAE